MAGSGNPVVDAGHRYRPEVDGMRAIAVVSVMLFHAGFTGIAGGYLGVDVFFAISGFLITGIIVRGVERGSFTLTDFYLRRIRRIVPALSVMVLLTTPFAVWLMLPDDLENYGQSLVASVVSANNILLYLTSNYFSLETLYKPLVHTWSLGVEEQYYLAIPLLVMAAMRLGRRRGTVVLLAFLTTASLIGSEYLRATDPTANFYLLPSRLWELGLGGLAALSQPSLLGYFAERPRARQFLVAAGLGATMLALIAFSETCNLPGWPTLVPVAGTCIVLALADASGAGRLLAAPPLVGIGLVSYSAYLYHQPVYALLRVASLNEPTPLNLAATIPLVLLLAWLSWKFVELPFRDVRRISVRQLLAFSGLTSAVLVTIGALLYLTSGLYALSPELAQNDALFGARQNIAYNEAPYVLEGRPYPTGDRNRNMLVIGDSFARDFVNMVNESPQTRDIAISYDRTRFCEAWSPELIARARQAGSVVLGSGVDRDTARCVGADIARLEWLGVPHIVVLGTKSFGFNNNAVMLLPRNQRYSYRARPLADAVTNNLVARKVVPARYYVDLLALLDDGQGTVPVFTPDRKFISQDRKHLTKAGARFLGPKVFADSRFSWLANPGK